MALIATEWVFVATILVLGVVTGLVTVRQGTEQSPTGGLVFGATTATVTPVPEPSALMLLSAGAVVAFVMRRRRRA